MPPDLIPHVFETFIRGSRAGGLGLGLAIVKSITELHGGRVTARSDGIGKGSELEVILPIRDLAVSRPKTPSVVPPAPEPGHRERGVILIVDDNADAAQLLGDALETYGFKTVVSHSPRAALEAARQHTPSIALVDIGLPEMDGYELALLLRAANPKLRCVALTGYSQHSDRARAAEAGFVDHLIKPIKLPALIPLLDKLLIS
jgi:CheY-like chemotaxis protein